VTINQQYEQLSDALMDYQTDVQSVIDTVVRLDADYQRCHQWLDALDKKTVEQVKWITQEEKQVGGMCKEQREHLYFFYKFCFLTWTIISGDKVIITY